MGFWNRVIPLDESTVEKTAQDDTRESWVIDFFGLVHGERVKGNKKREGIDAFGHQGQEIDLKSSTKGIWTFSTSARFGRRYIMKMLNVNFLFSTGKYTKKKFVFHAHRIANANMMRAFWHTWLRHFDVIEAENALVMRILKDPDTAVKFALEIAELESRCRELKNYKLLPKNKNSKSFLERIEERLEHGSTENDPKIPQIYVLENSVPITDTEALHAHLTGGEGA